MHAGASGGGVSDARSASANPFAELDSFAGAADAHDAGARRAAKEKARLAAAARQHEEREAAEREAIAELVSVREAERLKRRVCAACGDAIRPKADFGLTHHQCACRLGVYYCGRECQRAHRPEHREACRAAMGREAEG